jgi:hypothetical protein
VPLKASVVAVMLLPLKVRVFPVPVAEKVMVPVPALTAVEVFAEPSVRLPAIVRPPLVTQVSPPGHPVIVRLRQVPGVVMVQVVGLFPSNTALSDAVGTDALLEPPEVVDQLVLPVAVQAVEEPVPTQ